MRERSGKVHIRLKYPSKKKLIMYLVALLLIVPVLFLSLKSEEKSLQYEIVVLGDSIVGNIGEEGVAFTAYLEESLGKSVFKGGFGGSTMSFQNSMMWNSISSVEWSMVKLAEAICYDDWKSQKATMAYAESYKGINNQTAYYFGETMEKLCQIDFNQAEILIIEHGTNDYNSGRLLDNPEDLYDETTFGGALRKSLKLLRETYPNLRIVLMSPLYCELGENHALKCYSTKYGNGGYLDEYVAVEKEIAEEFGVEWLDAYHDSGIGEGNISQYSMDYLHLNAEGHKLVADFLADYFKAN